jgi:hypothetical protein
MRVRHVGRSILARRSRVPTSVEDDPSMLRTRNLSRRASGAVESRPVRGPDRAMDVLQYGMAILAFAVALLLAAMH